MLIALGKQTMFVIFSREKEIVYGYWFSGFSKFTYYLYIEMATWKIFSHQQMQFWQPLSIKNIKRYT